MRSMIANENNYVTKEKREQLFLCENEERIGVLFYFCQSRFTENLEN